MYAIVVALASGVLTAMLVGLRYNIYAMILTGFLISILVFFLVSRYLVGKLETLQQISIKQLENQKFDLAIKTLEAGNHLGRWIVFGRSQLNGQIGYIHYLRKDFDKAFPYLKNSFAKNWIAQAMLAACYYRRKDYTKMKETLESAVKSNKKTPFLWGLYAYMESVTGSKDRALEILNRGAQACPDDKALKANILNLQNKKKIKMNKFGDVWYQLWIESPPQRMTQGARPRFSAFRRR